MFQGSPSGISRTIPLREARDGAERVLRLVDVHAFDEAMRPLQAEVTYRGPSALIRAWIPGPSAAARTLTIFYRVRRGLLARQDADELYWHVTGTDWDVPIELAEVFVADPPGVPGTLVRSTAYMSPSGGPGPDYTEERTDHFIVFRTKRPLGPREGLTVVVEWPRGYVQRPSAWQEAGWFLADNWPLGLPLATLLLMVGLWRAYGGDPGRGRSIKPEYEPPPGLVPAEAGALVDGRAHPRDVVATFVDLAVRGYLHIEQVTNAFGGTDYLFKRLRPVEGDPDLKPLEVFVLARLFREDWALNLRLLSEVKHDYDTTFPPIREEIYRTIVADGLFAVSPELVRMVWTGLGLGLAAVAALLYLKAPQWIGPAPWLVPAGLAGSGLVLVTLSPLMLRRTAGGAQAVARLLGFREFLDRAEKDHLARLPGDTLHRWLPWSIAFGVSESWILNFRGVKVDPPLWFTGLQGFSLDKYQLDLSSFGDLTQDAIRTSRRSSGARAGGGGGGPV